MAKKNFFSGNAKNFPKFLTFIKFSEVKQRMGSTVLAFISLQIYRTICGITVPFAEWFVVVAVVSGRVDVKLKA